MKIRSIQTCITSSLPRCIFRCNVFTGFLLGIFFRGESIVMQISIVILLFSDQISGRGKSFQGEQTASGGAPLPALPVGESQFRYVTLVSFFF